MTRTRKTRRELLGRLGIAGATAIGAAVAGCTGGGDDGDGGGDGNTVGMSTAAYEPDSITVETGATVTWENDSNLNHTVTAYDDGIPEGGEYFASGEFDAEQAARDGYTGGDGVLEPDDNYEHTFGTAGEYEYFCIPHEQQGMTGTVTVE